MPFCQPPWRQCTKCTCAARVDAQARAARAAIAKTYATMRERAWFCLRFDSCCQCCGKKELPKAPWRPCQKQRSRPN
eukprot:7090612-Pyramimonas_sp.AAC.1